MTEPSQHAKDAAAKLGWAPEEDNQADEVIATIQSAIDAATAELLADTCAACGRGLDGRSHPCCGECVSEQDSYLRVRTELATLTAERDQLASLLGAAAHRHESTPEEVIGLLEQEIDRLKAASPAIPDDIVELARDLGYGWPDEPESHMRVLVQMAQTARHWRKQVNDWQHEIMKDRHVQHLQRRLTGYVKKLRNVRETAIEYKRGRDFDHACRLRELEQEIERLKALEPTA